MAVKSGETGYFDGVKGALSRLGIISAETGGGSSANRENSTFSKNEDNGESSDDDFGRFDEFESSDASGVTHSRLSSRHFGSHNSTSNSDIIPASELSDSSNSDGDDDDEDDDQVLTDDDNELNDGTAAAPDLELASAHTRTEFDQLFGSVDGLRSEKLYKANVCALGKEILYHGKMFVTSHHICFFSRLFNTQKLIIPFNEVIKIEPKMTMFFIPNAIAIQTVNDSRHVFASFNNRNRTISVLKRLRNSRIDDDTDQEPHSLNGDQITASENGNGDAEGQGPLPNAGTSTPTIVSGQRIRSSSNTSSLGKLKSSSLYNTATPSNTSFQPRTEEAFSDLTSSSEQPPATMAAGNGNNGGGTKSRSATTESSKKWPVENLGPEQHASTSPPSEKSNEKVISDEVIEAPLGVVANILFGSDTSWYKHFIVDVEKNKELKDLGPFSSLKPGEERSFDYIKPLSGPVGPKQTHCRSVEKIENWDLEKYIEVITTSTTPDVPSGSSFTTLTRVILSWGDDNSTHIRLGTWLEWTAKSWLKGPIERGAIDGQTSYCKSLVKELRKKTGSASKTEAVDNARPKPAADSDDEKPQTKSTKRSSTAKRAAQAIREWQQLCIGLSLTLLVLLILLIVTWRRSRQGTGRSIEDERNLLRIQQELELWQWIDDRKEPDVREKRSLTEANIEEAIAATEKKLASLKASLIS